MAQNSTQYALFASMPPLKVRSQDWYGVRRVASADFVGALVGGTANGCVNMLIVPAGSKILGGSLTWGALGASTQLFVGDQFVCDRFMLRADGATGNDLQVGGTPFPNGCGRFNNILGKGYVTTCDLTIIVANLNGTATSTAAGTSTPLLLEVEFTTV